MRPAATLPALAALLAAGCAGYRLGPTGGQTAGARSVEVATFANETFEPRLSDAVAGSLRRQLQQDGTFTLATQGDGDVQVSGRLVRFVREGISFTPADVITPQDYLLRLTAHVRAVERGTGRVLLDREVRGRTTIRISADLPLTEEQALPNLADNLARNITTLLVQGDL
jgi:hypothetical protein